MKTISPPKEPKVYRFTCSNQDCGAVLEADKHEGHVFHDRDGSGISFTCLHCGRTTVCAL